MASRKPEDLEPETHAKVLAWVAACAARGVDVLVYCTLRTPEEQAVLYGQGRTTKGPIITNAAPWQSFHQYGRAVDAVPMLNGKPDWSYSDLNGDKIPDEPWWNVMVEEADKQGLEWAGRWKGFREYVHWQFDGGHSLAELYEAHRMKGDPIV